MSRRRWPSGRAVPSRRRLLSPRSSVRRDERVEFGSVRLATLYLFVLFNYHLFALHGSLPLVRLGSRQSPAPAQHRRCSPTPPVRAQGRFIVRSTHTFFSHCLSSCRQAYLILHSGSGATRDRWPTQPSMASPPLTPPSPLSGPTLPSSTLR